MASSQEAHLWYNNCSGSRSKGVVINEVERGIQAAKQLRILHHFNKTLFLSSAEKLLDEIISSSERALTMLKFDPGSTHGPNADDAGSKNTHNQPSKKRKAMTICKKQVRVSLETGFDGTVEDGFNWRKYGQKDIQGARHPRGYYRCTHRQQVGCMATKHVQRSDEDPLLFYITYRGNHTCYSLPETQQLGVSKDKYSNTWTTNADTSLPPFPDDFYFATSSDFAVGSSSLQHFDQGGGFQQLEENNGGKSCFAMNSPMGMSESQVDSLDSDDGSHLSFDFNGLLSFD
ncbi:unnamed protein product [Rhodiola kirilowii]